MGKQNKAARIEIACATCGSTDVRRDALAEWNVETQDWELCSVQDQGYCESCEEEAKLIERPAASYCSCTRCGRPGHGADDCPLNRAKFTPGPMHPIKSGDEWAIVAKAGGCPDAVLAVCGYDTPEDRVEANARLFAAAPEMHAALQWFTGHLGTLAKSAAPGLELARAALAKAGGAA